MQASRSSSLTRRSLAAGLFGLALAGFALPGLDPARAQPFQAGPFPPAFSSFAVDIRPLRDKGLGPFADLVAAAVLDELHRSFSDRIDPRGPRLVVRLNSIFMTPFPDGRGGSPRWGDGGGGGGSDSLDGDAIAVGPRGEILAIHHQLAVLDVNTSILTPNEPGRAAALGHHYVRWLRRQLVR